jgi:hypothetical protein
MNTRAGSNIQKSFPRTGFQIALDESPLQFKHPGTTRPLVPFIIVLGALMIKSALHGNHSGLAKR